MFCEDMGAALRFPSNLLRDELMAHSLSGYYDAGDNGAWDKVRKLFAAMRDGALFLKKYRINRFNGGLFEADAELEGLNIPTRLFCQENQGANTETLLGPKDTLLYLSANYYFGTRPASGERGIGLYTLGRVFEQSITDLEYMEAKADGRVSLTELSKRKRDGVYYTPEWVTARIVEETVGTRLTDLKTDIGLIEIAPVTDEEAGQYRASKSDGRKKKTPHVHAYLSALDAYGFALERIRILDPACGSGAFLIQAFEYLLRERQWIAREKERIEGASGWWDADHAMKSVLSNNLFGVDLNAESVEITRLALWLRSALPDKPLGVLDRNIVCGNSLVEPDFYEMHKSSRFSEEERERINAFDWRAAFPKVFAAGGFDCVIGNPPYVKLQHFRQIQPEVTEYLLTASNPDGSPKYESSRTGNFDLYLPFIELGMNLLNEKGRMGYIAPNVWLMNEYGRGLRNRVKRTRRLDRWIDFKSFQVFDEATTYTALQFFRGSACSEVRYRLVPDGDLSVVEWADEHGDVVAYEDLPDNEAWNLVPGQERRLLKKLSTTHNRLGGSKWTQQIFQGLITSADSIYHLTKVAPGKYRQKRDQENGEEIAIEDELMRPLVSGPDAKRYQLPDTDTYLLFPYDLSGNRPRLWPKAEMESRFPKGWAYLNRHEEELRGRERGKMDKDGWWAYNYPKNLDKHERYKLGVAQTVPGMRVFFDPEGRFYFNNVRVNGILPHDIETGWFLLGILNSPVPDFVFRRTSKPKEGGYFEANKQFIAPLPIPDATPDEKRRVGQLAELLQELHTARRDRMLDIERRLQSGQTKSDKRPPTWLWADADTTLESRLTAIQEHLRPGAVLSAENDGGELRFLVDGIPVIDGVFEESPQAEFIAAQWDHLARTTRVTEKFTAKKLVQLLCSLKKSANPALMAQTARLTSDLSDLNIRISETEREINGLVYGLYGLTPEEIALVEAG